MNWYYIIVLCQHLYYSRNTRSSSITILTSIIYIRHDVIYTHLYKQLTPRSREANRCWANQEMPCTLWNLKVSLPYLQEAATCSYPEARRSNPCTPSHFSNLHFNIILPLCLGIPSDFFPQVFPSNPCMHLSCPRTCYMPCPSQFSRFDHPINITGECRA
jgi:hypothetical protein